MRVLGLNDHFNHLIVWHGHGWVDAKNRVESIFVLFDLEPLGHLVVPLQAIQFPHIEVPVESFDFKFWRWAIGIWQCISGTFGEFYPLSKSNFLNQSWIALVTPELLVE